nr:uncharacterized mitochondrial protein AtMg00860-like [Nicotiana tomentosiformis]
MRRGGWETLATSAKKGRFFGCRFCEEDSMALLGHVVSSNGIKVEPKKIEAVQSWPKPSTAKAIRSFLSLVSYYHRFIDGFSFIAALLTKLIQKRTPFRWFDECEESY